MRALLLCEHYPPSSDACAKRMSAMAEGLSSYGFEVVVLASETSCEGAGRPAAGAAGVFYYPTRPMGEKTVINRLRNNASEVSGAVSAARGLGRFDVVVCTVPPLMLAVAGECIARRSDARFVLDVRDVWPDVAYEMGTFSPRSVYGRVFERIASWAYARADLITAVTPGKVGKLRRKLSARERSKVRLVPNGIDEGFLENSIDPEVVSRFRLEDGSVCAYVGNIGLAQGLGTLLDIAKARPSVRFLLFGDGADRANLEMRAKAESVANVEFCGKVDERGVYTVLSYAVVAYVPLVSSRLRDSIPTKTYEALACGCPVLLAAEGDAVDLLGACGFGAHAAPEDPVALLAAFDRLMECPFSDEERAAASAWVIENHSRQRYLRLFAESMADFA